MENQFSVVNKTELRLKKEVVEYVSFRRVVKLLI
jgi:hypothetical protein